MLIGVVAVMFALRLSVGASVHLTEDEAYYRLWSMAPAFGYYDHPPMIAWWIWLGRRLLGDTPLGVRIGPIVACALTTAMIFDLARLAGADRRAAAQAGIWYNAMLLIALGGFLAVPDAPASLFWTLTLWCGLRAARASSTLWWLGAGATAGLAVLSKYSALFLAPGVLAWLLWTQAGRSELKRPGPWLAAVVAVLIAGVNIAWNAEHHWLTFAKQFGRITPTAFAPRYLAEFLVTQALLLNPLIALFAARALVGRAAPKRTNASLAPFIATSAPFVAYLLIHSLHDRVQAHWPAPVYPAVAICAAIFAASLPPSKLLAQLRTAVPVVGFGLCAAVFFYFLLPTRFTQAFDPALPVRGWPAFAHRLEVLRIERGASWIGTSSYGLAAELSDEPPIRAPILQISERERYAGPAPGKTPDLSRPGLVIDLPRRVSRAALGRCFAYVSPIGEVRRGSPGAPGSAYAVFLVASPTRDVVHAGCWDKGG